MNMNNKALLSISLLALILMTWQDHVLAANAGVSEQDIARIDDARDLYQSNCAACHGFDGSPIMAGVPNFAKYERLEKTDQELIASINDGKASDSGGIAMPPWEGALSPEEMQAVLDYIRVIKGDPVFQDTCLSCHESNIPPVAEQIPNTAEKLNMHEGPFNLCSGEDTDDSLEREDLINVILFLAGVSRN